MKSTEKLIKEKIKALEEENKRLNNIINELDRWLEQMEKYHMIVFYSVVKDKLKELKENKYEKDN